jgi:polyisoprenyl-phosphate glycosyltransferase
MHVTIVAPFYDEEAGASAFYEALAQEMDRLGLPYDMVFVDDGSGDRTPDILEAISRRDPLVTVMTLSRNFGHQAALTAGLSHAEGDVVVMMDSDLQHPPAVIGAMVAEHRKGADVVYAVRRQPRGLGLLKRATAEAYYGLLRRLTDVPVTHNAADFRLMSREALLALRSMREYHRYLRGMVPWLGFSSAYVTYDQPPRRAGRPSYTLRKSLRLAKDGLFSFSTVPLDLITGLGITLTVLAAAYLVYIFVVWASGRAAEGWASVLVALLMIGGIQLITLGVIAQYTGMIFEQVKGRPLYVVKAGRRQPSPQESDPDEAGGGHLPTTGA